MSDGSTSDELRAAYLDLQQAQARLDADRDAIRKKMLEAEPSWGPCLQCGHVWRSRNIRRRLGKPPRRCPKCLSSYWFDPEYIPRGPNHKKVPVQSGKAVGTESHEDKGQDTPFSRETVPTVMPPPPRFAPPESVRFAEDDPLEMMKKAKKDG